MFLESKFTSKSSKTEEPERRGDSGEPPLFAPRKKTVKELEPGNLFKDSEKTGSLKGSKKTENALVPTVNDARDASSSVTNKADPQVSPTLPEQDTSKAGAKTSFMGLKWKTTQPNRLKKPKSGSTPSMSQDDVEDVSCDQGRFLQESPEPKAGRLQCPFFRFRSKNVVLDDGAAQSSAKQSAVSLVTNASGQQQTSRRSEGHKKDKFWSRVIFPS